MFGYLAALDVVLTVYLTSNEVKLNMADSVTVSGGNISKTKQDTKKV